MTTDAKAEGREFVEFLELQGSPDLVTKSELLDFVRGGGGQISDRQLTFYTTERLVPKSVRVGSRSGVYPASVQWLLEWIVDMRERDVSVEAIRELVPLWKLIFRASGEHRLDLAEFELIARQHVRSQEAARAVPWLLPTYFYCPQHLKAWTVIRKDGQEESLADGASHSIGFLFASQEAETGKVQADGFARLAFPVHPANPADDPTIVVVGIPLGMEPPRFPEEEEHPHMERVSGEERAPAAETG